MGIYSKNKSEFGKCCLTFGMGSYQECNFVKILEEGAKLEQTFPNQEKMTEKLNNL